MARNVRYNFLLSDDEHGKLMQLAKWKGVTASAVLRMAIHEAHERQTEETPHRKVRGNHRNRARPKP